MPQLNDGSPKRPTLVERYIVPPFSVLDARKGYWQQRKRAWLDLGVDDAASRTQLRTSGSIAGTDPRYYHAKAKVEASLGRDLSHEEFLAKHYTPHADSRLRASTTGGIVSLFDPVLAEILYRWFCPPRGTVLDPFAGGAVRGIIAAVLGRRYVGVDLSEEQVASNRRTWSKLPAQLRRQATAPRWKIGDGRHVVRHSRGEYDFFFTCPPYGHLERYSDDPRDLSAMKHPQFIDAYRQVIAASTAMLKPDRFAAIVVGDYRDRRGFYSNFVSETIAAFEGAGLRYYNEAILHTMTGTLALRVGRMFDASRKLGKSHQNVLVFVKGDPRVATSAIGPLDLPEDPTQLVTIGKRRPRRNVKPKLAHGITFTPTRSIAA